VKLIGVEAGGRGDKGNPGAVSQAASVLQGTYSYVLQDAAGQIATTHSVSAGLDYPSVGRNSLACGHEACGYVAASDSGRSAPAWRRRKDYSGAGIGACSGEV
jgi:tryptophan synthase beta chain